MRRGPATVLLLAGAAISACSTPQATAAPTAPQPTGAQPATSSSPHLPSIAPSAPLAASPSSPVAGSGGPAAVVLDETLLGVLPPDVDGVAVAAEPDSFAAAASDPEFARNVAAAAFAIAVDGADLVSGVVARLRPGVYSEALFRDWRDSYNAGACAQAGGVVGNAEAALGGRTVHIARCAGGLIVYHVYLPERDAIVSVFSLGDRRLGERLMSDLRP